MKEVRTVRKDGGLVINRVLYTHPNLSSHIGERVTITEGSRRTRGHCDCGLLWSNINGMGEGLYGAEWERTKAQIVKQYAPGLKKYSELAYEQMQAIWGHLERESETEPQPA